MCYFQACCAIFLPVYMQVLFFAFCFKNWHIWWMKRHSLILKGGATWFLLIIYGIWGKFWSIASVLFLRVNFLFVHFFRFLQLGSYYDYHTKKHIIIHCFQTEGCFLIYLTFSTNFDFLHILMTFCTLRFIFWILSVFVFIFPSSTHSQEVFAYHGDLHKNAGWKYFSLYTHIFPIYLHTIKFRPINIEQCFLFMENIQILHKLVGW